MNKDLAARYVRAISLCNESYYHAERAAELVKLDASAVETETMQREAQLAVDKLKDAQKEISGMLKTMRSEGAPA